MMAKLADLRIGNKLLLAFALLILGFGAMLLFRRLEGAARQPLLLHELEARVSADGRSLVLSRYRERFKAMLSLS